MVVAWITWANFDFFDPQITIERKKLPASNLVHWWRSEPACIGSAQCLRLSERFFIKLLRLRKYPVNNTPTTLLTHVILYDLPSWDRFLSPELTVKVNGFIQMSKRLAIQTATSQYQICWTLLLSRFFFPWDVSMFSAPLSAQLLGLRKCYNLKSQPPL